LTQVDEAVMGQRFFDQALELWVNPEIESRRKRGIIPDDFRVRAFQVVFPGKGRDNIVRLNGEVKAVAKYRAAGPLEKGQQIEVLPERVGRFELPDDDDPDAAHLTSVQLGDKWVTSFDFTYNRQRAEQHAAASKEFLSLGRIAIQNLQLRPACELLFCAMELAVRAELILMPRDETKSHKEWAKRFTEWTKLGNAPSDGAVLLAKLIALRPRARYLEKPLTIGAAELVSYADGVEEQVVHVEDRLHWDPLSDQGED
jgi:hypothetical protein